MADAVTVRRADGSWSVQRPDGSRLVAHAVTDASGAVWVQIAGEVMVLEAPERRARRADHAPASLEAPMPALVLDVPAVVGAEVPSGAPLVLLEAMKMELPLRAPSRARVTAVHCARGDRVTPGRALVELEPLGPEA